jgi:hypothetical protein
MEIDPYKMQMMTAGRRLQYDRARIEEEPYTLCSQAVVRELETVLGRKTVAYLAGFSSMCEFASWLNGEGSQPRDDRDAVLRAALHALRYVVDFESVSSASAWFVVTNSNLEFDSPASTLRRRGFEARHDVVKAARTFVADALAAAERAAAVQTDASSRCRSSWSSPPTESSS